MPTYRVNVRPGGPRVLAALRASLAEDGAHVVEAPGFEERRDAASMGALAASAMTLVIQAADSESVKRAIEKVKAILPGGGIDASIVADDDDG
jgi:hypothetical protein